MRNTKAQVPELGTVLIVAVLIVIVVITYTWGKALFDAQKTRTTTEYMQAKLFETERAVLAVSHEGLNSTRVVNLDISEGTLILNNGSLFCSNRAMNANNIVYNITTKSRLIESDNYTNIDPFESNASCDAPFENSSIALMMGKSEKAGNSYVNSYALWFRNLTQKNGAVAGVPKDNFYFINITTPDAKHAGEGTHTLVITNIGTQNNSYTIETKVAIDII